MKISCRKFLSIFMVLTLLLATNGVVLIVHTCLVSNTTDVSLFQKNGCCGGEEFPCGTSAEISFFKDKCCDLKVTYSKIESPGSLTIEFNGDVFKQVICCDFKLKQWSCVEPFMLAKVLHPPPSIHTAAHPDFIYTAGSLLI